MRKPQIGELVHVNAKGFEPDAIYILVRRFYSDGVPYVTIKRGHGIDWWYDVPESVIVPTVTSGISVNFMIIHSQVIVEIVARKQTALAPIESVDAINMEMGANYVISRINRIMAVHGLSIDDASQQAMQRLENMQHLEVFHWGVN